MKLPGITLLWLVTSNATLLAAPPTETVEETVNYLLKYTAESNRVFIRNGKEYSSADAAKLMRYKYDANKKDVHSAEDFIRLAATKSGTTGQPYLVKLPDGKTVPAAEWLMEALTKHRAGTQKSPE